MTPKFRHVLIPLGSLMPGDSPRATESAGVNGISIVHRLSTRPTVMKIIKTDLQAIWNSTVSAIIT